MHKYVCIYVCSAINMKEISHVQQYGWTLKAFLYVKEIRQLKTNII